MSRNILLESIRHKSKRFLSVNDVTWMLSNKQMLSNEHFETGITRQTGRRDNRSHILRFHLHLPRTRWHRLSPKTDESMAKQAIKQPRAATSACHTHLFHPAQLQ